ncbi:MAG: tRNA (adenosine(37)-N6)-threonylcarbamoyltransferase complex ATPase subunit type 1 TsaE [Oscillospiraceae bacterium]|nr:tRNA (adenosine(37)-N6)-threonylcarbamoyltransferase complex ATPase subunit type 1 TsaE [Oscillospiraceae bacterium]
MEYISNNVEETKRIAAGFAKELKSGDVLCMYGNLGAGKTAFVQGLARGLGIDEPITSPTFTIVNEYQGDMPLYHFDVYRIGDSEEMYEIGYEEYVYGDGISVIEWAELIEDILPESRYSVTIIKDDTNDDYRKIIIEKVRE